jgi:hypothetical protein
MTKVILTIDLEQTLEDHRVRRYVNAYFRGDIKGKDLAWILKITSEEGQRLIAGLVSNAVAKNLGCNTQIIDDEPPKDMTSDGT